MEFIIQDYKFISAGFIVSDLCRQYSESQQEGKMLWASPLADTNKGPQTPAASALSSDAEELDMYTQIEGNIVLVGGYYKQGYVVNHY